LIYGLRKLNVNSAELDVRGASFLSLSDSVTPTNKSGDFEMIVNRLMPFAPRSAVRRDILAKMGITKLD
jgi:hypothetical protein